MTEFKIIAIDDDRDQVYPNDLSKCGIHLSNAKKAADKINKEITCHQPNTERTFIKTRTALENLSVDTAVILDLSFQQPAGSAPWEAAQKELGDLCTIIPNLILNKMKTGRIELKGVDYSVLPALLDGVALFPALLKSSKQCSILVVTVSTFGQTAGLRKLMRILNVHAKKNNLNIHFMTDSDGRDLEDWADDILNSLTYTWDKVFLSWHHSPWLDILISKWLEDHRDLFQKNEYRGNKFCSHEEIKNNQAHYSNLFDEMLQDKFSTTLELHDLKALLMLSPQTDPTDFFHVWKSEYPIPGWKILNGTALQKILQKVCGMDVSPIYGSILMPTCPAFPFIAALHALCVELQEDHDGMLDTAATIQLYGNGPYRLSIPLKKNAKETFGISKKWIEKCLGGRPELEKGVCKTLWMLSLSQVEINTGVFERTFKSEGNTKLRELQKQLLGIFRGPGYPVVSVGFAPHFINIYWS